MSAIEEVVVPDFSQFPTIAAQGDGTSVVPPSEFVFDGFAGVGASGRGDDGVGRKWGREGEGCVEIEGESGCASEIVKDCR